LFNNSSDFLTSFLSSCDDDVINFFDKEIVQIQCFVPITEDFTVTGTRIYNLNTELLQEVKNDILEIDVKLADIDYGSVILTYEDGSIIILSSLSMRKYSSEGNLLKHYKIEPVKELSPIINKIKSNSTIENSDILSYSEIIFRNNI
jgi:hypothetical protein